MNELVSQFTRSTWKIWRSGMLDELSSYYRACAGDDYNVFLTNSGFNDDRVTDHFGEYPPLSDEIFIKKSEFSSRSKCPFDFVITNMRLWLYVETEEAYVVVDMTKVRNIRSKNNWGHCSVEIATKDNSRVVYDKIRMKPDGAIIDFIIEQNEIQSGWIVPDINETETSESFKEISTPVWPAMVGFFLSEVVIGSGGGDIGSTSAFLCSVVTAIVIMLLTILIVGSINLSKKHQFDIQMLKSQGLDEEEITKLKNSATSWENVVSTSVAGGIIGGLFGCYGSFALSPVSFIIFSILMWQIKGNQQKWVAALVFGIIAGATCVFMRTRY